MVTADKDMVKRIVACYESADKLTVAAGKNWYPAVREIAGVMHPSVVAGAGVIAALSPRQRWDKNIEYAVTVCDAARSGGVMPSVGGTLRNVTKAWNIAVGSYKFDPIEELNSSEGSYKVNRFYYNILGDQSMVTVDVWATKVALPEFDGKAVRGNLYLRIEDAYKQAAKQIGTISARDLQAVCWVNVRGGGE
jgi:hypothetical protein